MKDFRRYLRICLSAVVAVLFFEIFFAAGTRALEQRPTDTFSEDLALRETKKLVDGEHSYGIVEYTHYPNGPQYVLTLMTKGGVTEKRRLRGAPVVFSSLCFALLGFSVCMLGASALLSAFGVAGVAIVLWQPGVIQWMGALYGNAYSLAICIAGLGVCLLRKGSNWAVWMLGFLSGWMGYDFTFCFIGSVLVGRLLVGAMADSNLVSVAKSAARAALFASSGVLVAIVSHIIQNALFFGSVKAAFNDLIGSAAARAGLPIASTLNPEYAQFIRNAALGQGKGANGEYPRWDVLGDLWRSFVSPEWTNYEVLVMAFLAVLAVNLCLLVIGRIVTKSCRFAIEPVRIAILGSLVSAVFGCMWFVCMPEHARFHFHFIQRQFFVPVLLVWLVLWCQCNRLRSEMAENKQQWGLF